MRLFKALNATCKETPADCAAVSHQLLVRGGYVRQFSSGLYAYLPLMQRVLTKIKAIIHEEIDAVDAQECLFPQLQPAELWQESGRWDEYSQQDGVMFSLADRQGRRFALGPTHEEVAVTIARELVQSYRQLPLTLYQIQTKFRDELRPKHGLIRSREFLMKDAYSFHETEACLDNLYNDMRGVYRRIFQRCGLQYRVVKADSGSMGGSESEEFMALADIGDNTIAHSDSDYNINIDALSGYTPSSTTAQAIEVGHIFKLGTRYTQSMGMVFSNQEGSLSTPYMGCYGIGVSRLAQAIVEQNHDAKGIVWPSEVSPYRIVIVCINYNDPDQARVSNELYNSLYYNHEIDVVLDDRPESAGVKFSEADLIGYPLRITVGRRAKDDVVDLKRRGQDRVIEMPYQHVVNTIAQFL